MTQVAFVIRRAALLDQQFKALGAQGRGLRERALDLDIHYPQSIFDDIAYISRWRNAIAHGDIEDLPAEEVGRFEQACNDVSSFVDGYLARHGAPGRRSEANQSQDAKQQAQHQDELRQERPQAALGLNAPQEQRATPASLEEVRKQPGTQNTDASPHRRSASELLITFGLAFIGVPLLFAIGYIGVANNDRSGGGLILLFFHGIFCLKLFFKILS